LYRAKDGWCQHLFAAPIVKRATTLVNQKLEASESSSIPVQEGIQESLSAMQKPGKASASCTLTFALPGVDVILTLHGPSEQVLFPRIRHALIWAKGLGNWLTEAEKPESDKSQMPTQNDQVS
jgi:hypothetical protein